MVRKILHAILVMMMVVTLLPAYPSGVFAATGDNFVFDNLPTAVNSERLTLTGTLNNVSSSGITYTVERMSSSDFSTATVLQKKDKSSFGVTVSSDGVKINVVNLPLFPGINRITFFGKRGASEVQTVLPPISYIDSPILYNLAFTGGGNKQPIEDTGVTVLSNNVSSNPSQGMFSIEGNAPNAKEVTIEFGENQSVAGTVREDGTNYFIVSQIKLKKGKNTIKFRVKNDTQNIEVVRDVVYFNDAVTFYDVEMQHNNGGGAATPLTQDLRLLSDFFVPNNTSSNYTLNGKIIVPNDFLATSEPMRIEAAYRLAGQGGISNNKYTPDQMDTIVLRFSSSVAGAGNMTTAQLKDLLDFQTKGTNPQSLNERITDSTASWSAATVNGATIDKSQLNIKIGPQDEKNGAFANLGRIVLKQTVSSASDANNKIDVIASPSQTIAGVEALTATWDSGAITKSGTDGTTIYTFTFKGATVTLRNAAPPAATSTSASRNIDLSAATPAQIATAVTQGFLDIQGAGGLSAYTFTAPGSNFVITRNTADTTDNADVVTVTKTGGAGTLNFANINGTSIGVQQTWDSGMLSPGLSTKLANGTSNTVSFGGASVTITAGATVAASAVNGTTGSVGVATGDQNSIVTALQNAFNAIKAVSGSPIANYTFTAVNTGGGVNFAKLVITGPQANTSLTVSGDGSLSFEGVTAGTVGGVTAAPEIQTIKAYTGVTTTTQLTIDFYDPIANTLNSKVVSLASTDNTADLVATQIRTILNTAPITTNYTVGGLGDVVTVTQKVASSHSPTITITTTSVNKDYNQVINVAGSFDPRFPYVTEAYVLGTSTTKSTRGVDNGEKLIIQLQNGTSVSLNGSQSSFTKVDIDNILALIDKTGTALNSGALGSSPAYSMSFNATSKQLEITFNNTTGLNPSLTKARVDAGVGATSADDATYIQVKPSNVISPTFQVESEQIQVRLGGSFDGDNGVANPDPKNIAAWTKLPVAIFLDQNLAEITRFTIGSAALSGGLTVVGTPNDHDPYFTFKFSIPVDQIPAVSSVLQYDKQIYVQLLADNAKKSRQQGGAPYPEGTDQTDLGYILRNSTAPYISGLSYNDTVPVSPTPSFSTFQNQPINDLKNGTTLNKLPFAIKLTIPNGTTASGNEIITINSTSAAGSTQPAPTQIPANRIFNGSTGTTREVWFFVESLPFNGTQTLDISYNDTDWATPTLTTSVQITSVSGINVRFDGLTEAQVIQYDPTESKSERADKVIRDALKDFKGEFSNVSIVSTDYNGTTTAAPQRIFLTINNNSIPLEANGSNLNRFILDDGVAGTVNNAASMSAQRQTILDYFNAGQNTIKIKYVGSNLTYEKEYVVNYFSINYPEIPKSPNGDVYPYGTDKVTPARDSRFTGSNGSYTTKEAEMNIFGSFDFIDLGTSYTSINAKRNSSSIQSNKYLLVIKGPDDQEWTWDMKTNSFTDTDGKSYNGTSPDRDLTVTYDTKGQYFTFILKNQKLPSDGNKALYNMYVYNDGLNGSSASFRLEVGANGLPYKLLKPYLPMQSTINQNYVEVVLYSENADSVTVNKVDAEKIDFDGNYDGDTSDSNDYKGAFRAIVKDLKPNKLNKVTFTIKRGTDTLTDSFEVFYALAYMPGAQVMETLKNSHKVFDGKLNLTFPKDTYLRRVDYDVPENLRTQLFKDHSILFAIANSKDGVVDRYDYVNPKPRGFSDLVEELGLRFNSSFDTHFSKASEVYWLDAGLADNPDSEEYDPYSTGILPHQLPNGDLPSYDSVPSNRMVVPNKRGTLELAYDPNIVSVAGNNITVMKYNPEKKTWENLGGEVNVSKKTIKIPFDKFGYYVVAKMNDSFQDVIRHPYARNQIEVMYSKGVILPKRSSEFVPDVAIKRAEFTAMVVRALGLPLVEKPTSYTFDDVLPGIDDGLWDYRYVETAARLGLVRGTNPRIFEPSGLITRQEAAVILSRALQLKTETNAAKTDKDLQKLFKDWNLIDPYARPYVVAIAKKKFIVGSPVDPSDLKKGYVFEPNANMLRGDAAILMSRVMTDLKKIPAVAEVK